VAIFLMALKRARSYKDHPGVWRLFSDVGVSTACLVCAWKVEGVRERELQLAGKGRGVRRRPL